jgi:Luciferase-like monooxygenase
MHGHGNTYRHPGVLAKIATTVDHISGGRLEFGLGAAWAEGEHTMLGLEFGTARQARSPRRGMPDHPLAVDQADHDLRRQALPADGSAVQPQAGPAAASATVGRWERSAADPADHGAVTPTPGTAAGARKRWHRSRIVRWLADAARFGRHRVGDRWHVDETYVKVAGRLRSAQVRPRDDAELLSQAEQYARIGVGEVIVMLPPDRPVARAEEVARLLPRLHGIG